MRTSKTARRAAPRKSNFLPVWVWAGAAALLVLIVAAFFFWQSSGAAGGLPAEISVSQAAVKRDAGAFILDVRQPEEWNEYHVPDSTLIPLGELASRLNEVPRDREIVVVCRSGNRSQQGRDILQQAGFEQVTSMAGGLSEWRAAGYPTVVGP